MEFEDHIQQSDMQDPVEMDEGDVADIFRDDDEDMGRADVVPPDQMVDALRQAGADVRTAEAATRSMYGLSTSKSSPSMMEAYGKSIHDHISRRNLNIRGLGALDLRTLKPNQTPWDFSKRADRKEARDLISAQDPDWIIGSPPCTPYSIWNFGINYKKMDPDKVKTMLAEGKVHLDFVCSLYRRQLRRGKHVLHEHPATALSWRQDSIEAIMKDPTVQAVVGDQCRYGLVTPSQYDKDTMVPAMKPTRFMTNSSLMADQLNLRCKRDHEHQQLVGNRCKDAAFYPMPLVKAMLKGISLQHEQDRRMGSVHQLSNVPLFAMPMGYGKGNKNGTEAEYGPQSFSSVPKVGGGKTPIVYDAFNFKATYVDEYTGEILAPTLIRAAMEDELNYFNSKV
jgi:hypothetical protein